ncbi:MAG: branched-chain amino acid ABC transporter permease [Trueperaceae bacterium]|nr:branched-chain amino acid ABC transporter permease [Trueperaceae bacterium]
MSFSQFALQLLTGLQIGAIYVLVALGLTLIFGTLGVANFAHGALYMIGAYFGLVVSSQLGWGWAALLVPLGLFGVGILFDRGLLQFFYKRPVTDQILVTFGLAIIIQELARTIFGGTTKPFPAPQWARIPVDIGFGYYPPWRLVIIAVTIIVVILLFILLRYTKFGLMVRAGMRDPEMVRYLGIDATRLFTIVVGLGAMFAGVAGIMGGPAYSIEPGSGMAMLVPSFLVVVIGGMGSLVGAVIAGLLMGLAVSFSVIFVPAVSQVIIYLVAVIVLIVRPRGLFGVEGIG